MVKPHFHSFLQLLALLALLSPRNVLVTGNQGQSNFAATQTQGQGFQGQWGIPPDQGDDQGYYGSQLSHNTPRHGQGPPIGQQDGPSYDHHSGDAAYGQQQQMGPPGQQYGSDQYRGQGQYGSYPGSRQQLGPPGHHDGGGRGGFNIGGLFNRAKDIAAKAADAASVFVAGGPDLVPPPQFQDQINALPGQSGMGFSGPGVPPGAGAFGPGGPPPPPPPLGRTDPDIPGGYTSTGQQEEQGRGFGDAMADGAKGLFGRVRGLFAEERDLFPLRITFSPALGRGRGRGRRSTSITIKIRGRAKVWRISLEKVLKGLGLVRRRPWTEVPLSSHGKCRLTRAKARGK